MREGGEEGRGEGGRQAAEVWSQLTWMIGSFLRRSHTTERPLGEVEARMCWTWEGGGDRRAPTL